MVPDWTQWTWEQPARQPDPRGDVVVPVLQSVISGLMGGAMVTVAASLLAVRASWSWWVPLAAGGCAAVGVMGAAWSWLLADHRRLLRRVETVTRRDPDAERERDPVGIRLEVRQERGGRHAPGYLFADLPVSVELFRTWSQAVTNGRGLSESDWTGGGRPFSRAEYSELMDALARARVVKWVNPRAHAQGRELTKMGREALAAFLDR